TGVSIHEGGFFGRIGPWLNTLFASALVWMSVTGVMAWWRRKPANAMGVPPRAARPWPLWLRCSSVLLFALLPLLTLSAALLWLAERLWLSLTPQTMR
ncbi:MAG: PepSY domain-containing protein, partial [Pseudoxanthomonas sp.]